MAMGHRLTDKQIQRVVQLYDQGVKVRVIASQLDINVKYVPEVVRRYRKDPTYGKGTSSNQG